DARIDGSLEHQRTSVTVPLRDPTGSAAPSCAEASPVVKGRRGSGITPQRARPRAFRIERLPPPDLWSAACSPLLQREGSGRPTRRALMAKKGTKTDDQKR